jgi:peptidoglycan/xylan/chitin deacetylase (PgdA/CDA1 family)
MTAARWKTAIKAICGRALTATGLHRLLMERVPLVVAFHRVNDNMLPDGLTCSIRTFDAYCGMFARYFRVQSLTELVSRVERGVSASCDLAITFDDGYADNHQYAAPILERHGLSATFFVATDYIGSARVAEWDQDVEFVPGWMTWDQVRDLHARGFEIGAHTANHVDLGTVDLGTARREIFESRNRVAKELASPPPIHFAYPFGGEMNISPEARALVVEAGFRSCVSCNGGSNLGVHPHGLRRVPLASRICSRPGPLIYGPLVLRVMPVMGWGWYYRSTVFDEYSRKISAWRLGATMRVEDVTETLDLARAVTGVDRVRVQYNLACSATTVLATSPRT